MGVLGTKIQARQAKLEGKVATVVDQIDHEIKLSRDVTNNQKGCEINRPCLTAHTLQTVVCDN